MSSEDDAVDGGVDGGVDLDARDKAPEANGNAPVNGLTSNGAGDGADAAVQAAVEAAQAELDVAMARLKLAQAKVHAATVKPAAEPAAEPAAANATPAGPSAVEPAVEAAPTAETASPAPAEAEKPTGAVTEAITAPASAEEPAEAKVESKPGDTAEIKPEAETAAATAVAATVAATASDDKAGSSSPAVSDDKDDKVGSDDKDGTETVSAVAGSKPEDKTETVPVVAEAKTEDKTEVFAPVAEPAPEAETEAFVPVAPAKSGVSSLLESTKAKVIAAVALVLVICLAGGGYYLYSNTHVPSNVAFRVYGQNVTIDELNDDMQADKALYGFVPPPAGPQLDRFRRDFAKATAVSLAIVHVAQQRGIAVADRQVSDNLASYINQVYGPGNDGQAKFVQDLANKGTSQGKVLDELKRQATLTKLNQQVTAGIQVSDQEVQQYFNAHHAQLATPELRDLHNIVVATPDEGTDIINKIKAGASFDQLAAQDSLDDSTKQHAGEFGHPMSAQELEPAYAQAAFSAPVTGVFGPVHDSHGWSVGLVVSVSPSSPAVFAKIKEPLRLALTEQKQLAKWTQFLGEQIKAAGVIYNPTYRPDKPDSVPSADDQGGQGPSAPAPGAPAAQAPPK